MTEQAAGYTIISPADAAWDTDVLKSTAKHLHGPYSIQFANTTPSANTVIETPHEPCEGSTQVRAWMRVQADSIAAGNTVGLSIRWYDETDTYISANYCFNAVLGAINTWEMHGSGNTAPSNARFYSIAIEKKNTAFNVYVDEILHETQPASFEYEQSAPQAIATGASGTTIVFNSVVFEYRSTMNTGTGVFVVQEPGVWLFTADVEFQSPADGDSVGLMFMVGGSGIWQSSQALGAAKNAHVPLALKTFVGPVNSLSLKAIHDHGSDLNVRAKLYGTLIR